MILNSINISNFRSFDDYGVDFHPRMNVIVGNNGSGKTSLLDAIKAIFPFIIKVFTDTEADLPKKAFSLYHYPYLSLKDFLNKDDYIKFNFTLDDENFDFKSRFNFDNEKIITKSDIAYRTFSDSLLMKNNEYLPLLSYYSTKRYIKDRNARLVKSFQGFYSRANACYQNFLDPYINYQELLAFFDSLNNFEARVIRASRDLDFRLPVLDTLRRAFHTMLEGCYHSPDFDIGTQEMTLTMNTEAGKKTIPASSLSHGYQSIMLLTLDLVLRMFMANGEKNFGHGDFLMSPAIVLIDEIDMHLHASWQKVILSQLTSLFPRTQFIVSSNSKDLDCSLDSKVIEL
jgi:predicted ATP-binding protein involved in virulence